nr:phosphate/phosphite/phosphonate ABC transporter substrate-binding protein [Sphingobium sp. OAS761]
MILSLVLASCSSEPQQQINIGIMSTDSSLVLKERWEPVFADLRRRTGLKVDAFYAPNYAGIVQAMRFNKVQVAFLGGMSALEATQRADGEVFAKVVEADGRAGYNAVLITRAGNRLRSADDVLRQARNLTFAIGDANSTSGTLAPVHYLFSSPGQDYRGRFKLLVSAGHQANILAVVNRQVDVATSSTQMLSVLRTSHPDQFRKIKVIWTSPLIPSAMMVYRRDLPEATKASLRTFFLSYGESDPHEKKVLAGLVTITGFTKPASGDLDFIKNLSTGRR